MDYSCTTCVHGSLRTVEDIEACTTCNDGSLFVPVCDCSESENEGRFTCGKQRNNHNRRAPECR